MPRPTDPCKQQHWLQHVRRWHASQLSVRDYCQRHRLGEASFYSWKRRLLQRGLLGDSARAAAPANAPLFLPVAVPAADPMTRRIELVSPAGWTVRLAVGFDAATLRQLLAVLGEQPC
jgi:hypothetical protein